ncbi:MAG TPA: hypothetical protein ENK43_10515 [Planctomycetes bacterium]|nr:hypothetical protein [Planctomycetota bacterium]
MTSTGESSAFDRYLDALLAGDVLSPEEFLRREGIDAGQVNDVFGHLFEIVRGRSLEETLCLAPVEADLGRERLGGFRLLRRLGKGGMGEVFLAEQEKLGRLVALKILPAGSSLSPTAIERFRREARAAARLRHPNIVRLLEVGEADGIRFIAMDFVPGKSLAAKIASARAHERQLNAASILQWGADVCDALEAAHAEGIAHRDVKPGNIMIDRDGRALLLDFGLAKSLSEDEFNLTTSFAGSPRYAAPEQLGAHGGRIDARTDVYGLGVTLFEACTLSPPFRADSVERLYDRILNEEPPPLHSVNPDVPRDLACVLARAMEKDPSDRFPSAAAFGEDLRRILAYRPILSRPPGAIGRFIRWRRRHRALCNALAASLVVLAFAVGWGVVQAQKREQARRGQAQRLVADARALLKIYERDRVPVENRQWRLRALNSLAENRRLTTEETAERTRLTLSVEREVQERALALTRVLEVLSRAEEVDPGIEGLDDTRARLYHQRWLDNRSPRGGPIGRYYRKLALQYGRTSEWRDRLADATPVTITSMPPGAEVHLFRSIPQSRLSEIWPHARWIEEATEIRRVPVPLGKTPPSMMPGRFAYRVLSGRGGLRRGDLIPASRGSGPPRSGQPVRLWRWGRWVSASLPDGVRMVPTAAPLLMSDATRLGTTPLEGVMIGAGEYLAVLRREGFDDCRVSFHVDYREDPYHRHGHADTSVRLLASDEIPKGFVRVTTEIDSLEQATVLAMMRHEVTVDEYLQFLNSREVLDEMAKAGRSLHVPRQTSGAPLVQGDHVVGFRSLDAEQGKLPVVGISHGDAQCYVAWRNRTVPSGWRYGLPTRDDWERGLYGGETRRFAFGDFFHPGWTNSRFSRDIVGREAVMSYWRDESIFGAFDMMGSVAEWGEGNDDGDRVPVFGGCFSDSKAVDFTNSRVRHVEPGRVADWIGFRLVVRETRGEDR